MTADKIKLVKERIKQINKRADVHVVAGVVSKSVPRKFVKYAAYTPPSSFTRIERLSEGLARGKIHLPNLLSLA